MHWRDLKDFIPVLNSSHLYCPRMFQQTVAVFRQPPVISIVHLGNLARWVSDAYAEMLCANR